MCIFFSVLNSIMEGRKHRSRELLKAIFFITKNNKKADWLCMKFSSTSNISVYLSRIFLELFLKPVYPTIVAEKFQIHGVKSTGKYSPQILIITTPSRKRLPTSPEQRFLKIYFSPAERGGEDYGAEKMTKIKLVRVLVTSSDKFHHFCNLYIFGFCFFVP